MNLPSTINEIFHTFIKLIIIWTSLFIFLNQRSSWCISPWWIASTSLASFTSSWRITLLLIRYARFWRKILFHFFLMLLLHYIYLLWSKIIWAIHVMNIVRVFKTLIIITASLIIYKLVICITTSKSLLTSSNWSLIIRWINLRPILRIRIRINLHLMK